MQWETSPLGMYRGSHINCYIVTLFKAYVNHFTFVAFKILSLVSLLPIVLNLHTIDNPVGRKTVATQKFFVVGWPYSYCENSVFHRDNS